MSRGINEPGCMKREGIAEQCGCVKSNQRLFAPQVHRNGGWHQKAEKHHQRQIKPKRGIKSGSGQK